MNQVILFLLIQNLLDIKQVLQEIAGYDANKVGKNKTEVVIPLKHLSNFWRSLNIPLINCEVELILTWFKNYVLIDKSTREADYDAPIHNQKSKSGFKRTIKWNKYRSQMTIQPQNNNLNCLIDPTFTNVNRLFVLPFTRIMQLITETLFQIITYQTLK